MLSEVVLEREVALPSDNQFDILRPINSSLMNNTDTKCKYGSLTNGFGIAVQFMLALLAFSCLILKRFCEPKEHRRSWKIWLFDTSKQGVGAGVVHVANIWLSQSQKDPCAWYVLNFLLDSTVGLFIIYTALQLANCISKRCGIKSLKNGDYGDPPNCTRWIVQCIVYVSVMLMVKCIVAALLLIPIWTPVSLVILSPIRNAELEVILVMFLIPLVVNALIFWVVDNFLMKTMKMPKLRKKTNLEYVKLVTKDPDVESEPEVSLLGRNLSK